MIKIKDKSFPKDKRQKAKDKNRFRDNCFTFLVWRLILCVWRFEAQSAGHRAQGKEPGDRFGLRVSSKVQSGYWYTPLISTR
jgi:hypothetical protein